MSYTFSRRDFMKYTALTAVAIAGSGMLTGCSNPNQPTGTVGSTLKPGGGICEATLLSGNSKPTFTTEGNVLVCHFKIKSLVAGLQVSAGHFQVDVTGGNHPGSYNVNTYPTGATRATFDLSGGDDATTKNKVLSDVALKVTGIDLTGATNVAVRYCPKHSADENGKDLYNDVYATWNITASDLGL